MTGAPADEPTRTPPGRDPRDRGRRPRPNAGRRALPPWPAHPRRPSPARRPTAPTRPRAAQGGQASGRRPAHSWPPAGPTRWSAPHQRQVRRGHRRPPVTPDHNTDENRTRSDPQRSQQRPHDADAAAARDGNAPAGSGPLAPQRQAWPRDRRSCGRPCPSAGCRQTAQPVREMPAPEAGRLRPLARALLAAAADLHAARTATGDLTASSATRPPRPSAVDTTGGP